MMVPIIATAFDKHYYHNHKHTRSRNHKYQQHQKKRTTICDMTNSIARIPPRPLHYVCTEEAEVQGCR